VFAELHAVTMRDSVSFHLAWDLFEESGEPRDPDGYNAAATTMLDQLAWWATALRTAREVDASRVEESEATSVRDPPMVGTSEAGR